MCLRTNTLVTTRERLLAELAAAGAEAAPSRWCGDGIIVSRLGEVGLGELLAKLPDSFYVQDESSMLVAGLLQACRSAVWKILQYFFESSLFLSYGHLLSILRSQILLLQYKYSISQPMSLFNYGAYVPSSVPCISDKEL